MISLGPHPTAVAPPLQPTAPSPKADNENSSFAACQKLLSTPQAPTSKPNPISPASPSRSSLASARPQLPLVRRSITNQREGVQPTRSLAVPPSAVLAIPPKPPRLHAPETQLPATSARARSIHELHAASPRESAPHELPQECTGVQTGEEEFLPRQPKSDSAAASHQRRQRASTSQNLAAATRPVRAPGRPPSNPAKPRAPSKIHPARPASQTPATFAPAPR